MQTFLKCNKTTTKRTNTLGKGGDAVEERADEAPEAPAAEEPEPVAAGVSKKKPKEAATKKTGSSNT